ncbi:MAG: sulfite oxidase [Thermoplasmata archaeon]|nr:sulfite oxidase [Thermoplasmata archaeon]
MGTSREGHPPSAATNGSPEPREGDLGQLHEVVHDPLCAEPPVGDLSAWVTPVERFFIRSHFPVPQIDVDAWRLVIEGEVERRTMLKFSDLRSLAESSLVATMECAGNSRSAVQPPADGVRWNHGAVGTARWSGVPLGDLLRQAGLKASAREVVFEGADHGREAGVDGELRYAMSVPLEKACDPGTLVALEMNGAPLTPHHGFPARIVVPGWYGMASVKWISRIIVADQPFTGFFKTRPYVFIQEGDPVDRPKRPVTTLRVKSLITWPPSGATLPPGRHVVRGVAWSGEGTIERVEVAAGSIGRSDDSAGWEAATLLEPRAPHAWVRWEATLDLARPGYYVLRARARDDAGHIQPVRTDWNFRGVATNSMHAIPIIVHPGGPAGPPTASDGS